MSNLQSIYLGAGCFWCVEAVFQRLKGVVSVSSGYMGGHDPAPNYNSVCTGATGHAEVVKVTYDEDVIGTETILEVFWHSHNPTTINQQGADKGTQYRSAIFYTNDLQLELAITTRQTVGSMIWSDPIVTQISPATDYFEAELYHQNYYNGHSGQSYCTYVIYPKLAKLEKNFADKLIK
jgi:peptide-methionine (S)-S-oxide reductase